ncbi:hypothetical protein Cgig2_014394 [Carnegiea gigantea]|uniref:Uncharacterized protein n=1 Tax=Carnegiea gigantea TaxID=171969 RepID=A0A9Q1QA38_9CARY|nr:hypothetical protein Cgig2_014394 [Carnegiea gigantea]
METLCIYNDGGVVCLVKANLELVRIESVNKRVHVGFVYFLRFVAKDLNTGYTGFYRAAVHLFLSTLTLVHFKDEVDVTSSLVVKFEMLIALVHASLHILPQPNRTNVHSLLHYLNLTANSSLSHAIEPLNNDKRRARNAGSGPADATHMDPTGLVAHESDSAQIGPSEINNTVGIAGPTVAEPTVIQYGLNDHAEPTIEARESASGLLNRDGTGPIRKFQ